MTTPSRSMGSEPALRLVSQEIDDLVIEDDSLDQELWMNFFRTEYGRAPYPWEVNEYRGLLPMYRRHCLSRLGKSFLRFGAPLHRMKGIMSTAAAAMEVHESSKFIFLPNTIITAFDDEASLRGSELKVSKVNPRLDLGRLSSTYDIYKAITHGRMCAKEAADRLGALLDENFKPCWGNVARCFFGFAQAFLVCPLAFSGSFLDMWAAGLLGLFVNVLSVFATEKLSIFSTVFEIVAVIIVSFVARGISAIRNSQYFCYQAVSTAGIVSLLPGFLILSAVQELAAKRGLSGCVKFVYVIVYSLFLGYALDFGSEFYLLIDHNEGRLRDVAVQAAKVSNIVHGSFSQPHRQTSAVPWTSGRFTAEALSTPLTISQNHFLADTCYRSHTFPWYLQPFPWWTLFILVPLYSIATAFRNFQPLHSTFKKNKTLVVMIAISCMSYAANRASFTYLMRSDSVTAVGAIVVGLLGNLYSRLVGGQAYPAMVPGVLFLVPSGIPSGSADSYTGKDITVRILQVSIGITTGFGLSNYLIYASSWNWTKRLRPKEMDRKWQRKGPKQAIFAF
ncbi:uncharacterized protein EI90DRAFT_183617 [Cantharellus anzutake]|uniref:uncharacterized protein n=1 Tax=Cantharellus anzutake TaxID=1750568 RepID=UPI001903A9C9|nr:uncharacterized protein EI90DRAFT_183617 [Cantharellus anzutake]KAF8336512.1 hypothetical protein EI90DRAFT_183617 [Cantharellus anzutake]